MREEDSEGAPFGEDGEVKSARGTPDVGRVEGFDGGRGAEKRGWHEPEGLDGGGREGEDPTDLHRGAECVWGKLRAVGCTRYLPSKRW